mmetsp:Transcript_21113/g.44367  ORF Transcript_21113/g.44367 Transcript_21113/m.44367 type:complete len:151 (-) Transcript_21113:1391-1843(-)
MDLHTHLLPPTHGALCPWGIDELLTFHYLVAEYFVTAPPSVTPENFCARGKQKQADLVCDGLAEEIRNRDLEAIRAFYRKHRERGPGGAGDFCRGVFRPLRPAVRDEHPLRAHRGAALEADAGGLPALRSVGLPGRIRCWRATGPPSKPR